MAAYVKELRDMRFYKKNEVINKEEFIEQFINKHSPRNCIVLYRDIFLFQE
jgi:hypothetical protein